MDSFRKYIHCLSCKSIATFITRHGDTYYYTCLACGFSWREVRGTDMIQARVLDQKTRKELKQWMKEWIGKNNKYFLK